MARPRPRASPDPAREPGRPAPAPQDLPVPARGPAILAVLLAAIVCYANALGAGFVYDDDTSIVANPSIDSFAIESRSEPPTRAIAYTTFTLNHRLGGLEPAGYRAVNVGIHALGGLAVLAFASVLLGAAGRGSARPRGLAAVAPLAAALLFVVHPLQTQAVAYVVQRITSLATLLYVTALALYAWARTAGGASSLRRRGAWVGALAAATLAMFTKEIAVTLPVAIALVELAVGRGRLRDRVLPVFPFLALLPVIPLTLAGGGEAAVQALSDPAAAAGVARGDSTLPRSEYVATQTRVVLAYLRLALLPVGQNLDPDFPVEHDPFAPAVLLSSLALAALAAAAGWGFWRGRPAGARVAGLGGLLFFLGLSVESLVPLADVMVEHRMYLPMVGLALASGGALAWGGERWPAAGRPVAGAVAVALVALGAATVARNRVWRDPLAVWSDAVAKSPGKARPHYNLGNVRLDAGDLAGAEQAWREAARLDPGHSWALNQLGSAALVRGDRAGAEAFYRRAISTPLVNPEAYFNLALVLDATGRGAEAAAMYRAFFDLRPAGREAELERLRRRFGWR